MCGWGQPTDSAGAASEESPIITRDLNPRLKSPINLMAKDASLSEILKVLSERSGMNFVAGSGVEREKITIILNKTPLDEAINLLVRAAGLSYEIIGNSVLIAETEKLKDEIGQSGYVVNLKYAKAPEVAKMLSDITKNIKVDEGGNKLVCYTSPRVILEIEKIIKATDFPHILVLLETRLIEVSLDRLDQYGIDWNSFSPLQTKLQAPEAKVVDGIHAGDWRRLSLDFNVTLDMLVTNGDARVLMDSKLTTTNNREATLHIGELVPYEIQTYNAGVAGGASLQIQKEEVGVKLTVTPHVNEANQITLNIEPEVSSIIGWKGINSDLPYVRIRKTNTTIRVENQQTIFIAGLLSEEDTQEEAKLPILGHIPLIGRLFTHTRHQVARKNLVIEITPKIIHDSRELSYTPDLNLLPGKDADKNTERKGKTAK
jgi:type II secretory pathway component GspD/PulD (secretin)